VTPNVLASYLCVPVQFVRDVKKEAYLCCVSFNGCEWRPSFRPNTLKWSLAN
jgi:hypothetical protein